MSDGVPARRPLLRCLLIFLLFVVLGPPVGAIVYIAGNSLVQTERFTDLAGVAMAPLLGLMIAPLSYLLGAVPAAVAGAIVGIRQAFFGPVSGSAAVAIGVAVGVLFVLTTDGMGSLPNWRSEFGLLVVQVAMCAASTWVCWRVVRKYHAAPENT